MSIYTFSAILSNNIVFYNYKITYQNKNRKHNTFYSLS